MNNQHETENIIQCTCNTRTKSVPPGANRLCSR